MSSIALLKWLCSFLPFKATSAEVITKVPSLYVVYTIEQHRLLMVRSCKCLLVIVVFHSASSINLVCSQIIQVSFVKYNDSTKRELRLKLVNLTFFLMFGSFVF